MELWSLMTLSLFGMMDKEEFVEDERRVIKFCLQCETTLIRGVMYGVQFHIEANLL